MFEPGKGMKHLKTVLRRERLPLPPVPRPLQERLGVLDQRTWGTRPLLVSLYDIQAHAEQTVDDPEDFVLIGHAGHGVNSWFFHCYISQGPLTVLVQAPWGGRLTDAKSAARGLAVRYQLLGELFAAMNEVRVSDRPLPGRLIIQQSSVTDPRWAWVEEGVATRWNEEFANAMTPALESLRSLNHPATKTNS